VVQIDVKPGWKGGTKITFNGKGDVRPGRLPADVVFTITEKNHATFVRSGNDLVCTHRVPLRDALCGTTVEVVTLDGRVLRVPVTEIITPHQEKAVAGEGMPINKSPGTRGNLRIKFEVLFPSQLNATQKQALRDVLPAH